MIRFLASAGMRGHLYDSIETFLQDGKCAMFSAVVVDSALMDHSGYEQVRHSREGAPLPVIAISKTDAPAERTVAQESGASAFFREPLDGETLLDAIRWEQGANQQITIER